MNIKFLFSSLSERYATMSRLNRFLIRAGALLVLYQVMVAVVHNVLVIRAVFIEAMKILTRFIVHASCGILKLLGENAKTYRNIVYIENSNGVRVIFSCLGLSLMALFAGFIISYPGRTRHKCWYIPAGIGLIIIMNLLRITGMALLSYHAPEWLDFYHHYVFKFTLHGFILLLWVFWIKQYGNPGT
jgi:exosortase family protein XrtF